MPKISKKNKIKKIKRIIYSLLLLVALFLWASYYFYQKGIEDAKINELKNSLEKPDFQETNTPEEPFDVSFEEIKKTNSHSQIKMIKSWDENIKKIWILTCQANYSDKYDSKYYFLENIDNSKNEYFFNIDKWFNNYCDIPYKFLFETEKNTYEKEFSLPSTSKNISKKNIDKILTFYGLSSLDYPSEIPENSDFLRLEVYWNKCGLFNDILKDSKDCWTENAFIIKKLAYSLYHLSFFNLDDQKIKSSVLFSLKKNKQIIDIYSKNSPYNNFLSSKQRGKFVVFPDFLYNLDKWEITSFWRQVNSNFTHFISYISWDLVLEDIITWKVISIVWVPEKDFSNHISVEDKYVSMLSKKPDENWYYTIYYWKVIWGSALMKYYKVWEIDCSDMNHNIPPSQIQDLILIKDKKIQTSWFCPVWIENSIFDLETLSLED